MYRGFLKKKNSLIPQKFLEKTKIVKRKNQKRAYLFKKNKSTNPTSLTFRTKQISYVLYRKESKNLIRKEFRELENQSLN